MGDTISKMDRAIQHAENIVQSYQHTTPDCRIAQENKKIALWLKQLKNYKNKDKKFKETFQRIPELFSEVIEIYLAYKTILEFDDQIAKEMAIKDIFNDWKDMFERILEEDDIIDNNHDKQKGADTNDQ